jgi:hypothetical protein
MRFMYGAPPPPYPAYQRHAEEHIDRLVCVQPASGDGGATQTLNSIAAAIHNPTTTTSRALGFLPVSRPVPPFGWHLVVQPDGSWYTVMS